MGLFGKIFKKKDNLIAHSDHVSMDDMAKIQSELQHKMDPETYNSIFNQACRLIPNGQFAEAIPLFESVKQNTEDRYEIGKCENQIGVCYFFLGDFGKALGHYTEAFKNGFEPAMIDDNIWEVCEELMKSDGESKKWAQHYMDLFPNGRHAAKATTFGADTTPIIPNVMKNIRLAALDKYKGNPKYELVEGTVFKDLEEGHFVCAISYELEGSEDSQYPLEDVLDQFYLHVSDFIDEESFHTAKSKTIELGGDAEDVKTAIASIVGKSIYNSDYVGEDGQTYVKLVIE